MAMTIRLPAELDAELLPADIAAAAAEFVTGPLLDNPRRVGKPLTSPNGRASRQGIPDGMPDR